MRKNQCITGATRKWIHDLLTRYHRLFDRRYDIFPFLPKRKPRHRSQTWWYSPLERYLSGNMVDSGHMIFTAMGLILQELSTHGNSRTAVMQWCICPTGESYFGEQDTTCPKSDFLLTIHVLDDSAIHAIQTGAILLHGWSRPRPVNDGHRIAIGQDWPDCILIDERDEWWTIKLLQFSDYGHVESTSSCGYFRTWTCRIDIKLWLFRKRICGIDMSDRRIDGYVSSFVYFLSFTAHRKGHTRGEILIDSLHRFTTSIIALVLIAWKRC